MKRTAQYDYTIVKPGYWQRDLFGNVITGQAAEPITRPEPTAQAQQTTMFDGSLVGTVAEMAAKNQIPSAYRTILALAQLDANRQHIALTALAHYRQFTPASFKDYCGHLAAEQAAEETGPELLLGVVPESAILPEAAEVAPVPALDGDLQATNVMLAPRDTTVLTTVRAALGAAGVAEHGAAGYGWFVIDGDNPARVLLGWTARPITQRGAFPSDGRAMLRQHCEAAGLICFDDDYRRGVWVQLTRFP